jgi:hypothetical protein
MPKLPYKLEASEVQADDEQQVWLVLKENSELS